MLTHESPSPAFHTALCVIPPAELCALIERTRAQHDKAYARWPPHINLLFPFVGDIVGRGNGSGEDSSSTFPPDVVAAVRAALLRVEPFDVVLDHHHFLQQGKRRKGLYNFTVHLAPADPGPLQRLCQSVEAGLVAAEGESESVADSWIQTVVAQKRDQRKLLLPHLTVGQFEATDAAALQANVLDRLDRGEPPPGEVVVEGGDCEIEVKCGGGGSSESRNGEEDCRRRRAGVASRPRLFGLPNWEGGKNGSAGTDRIWGNQNYIKYGREQIQLGGERSVKKPWKRNPGKKPWKF